MSDSEKSARYNWLDRSAVRVRFDAHPYGARPNPGFDPLKNDWIITKKQDKPAFLSLMVELKGIEPSTY